MIIHAALAFALWSCRAGAIQPGAQQAYEAPIRDLPWAQLNFLHTTDVHGWLGGHLQESVVAPRSSSFDCRMADIPRPSFSADWGDYISFTSHLRARADADGSDLIVVDTGDRIEGNGLFDGSEPKGEYYYDIYKHQQIDLICVGNHELYKANSSNNELRSTVPNYKNSYIASNLDIIDPDRGTREPLAPRFRKFETKNQKLRILSFGFLFDFTGNTNNTIVQPVAQTIQEEWFKKALEDRDVDIIVVIGHVGARMLEYKLIYQAIRDAHWDTPILFFGGHVHVRDFAIYDKTAVALASGRYLETVGFLSINGVKPGKKKTDVALKDSASIEISRRYIDNNLFSFHHHTSSNETSFPTKLGRQVSANITKARKSLKLDRIHACAPETLYVNRAPYPSDSSIFSWLADEVFPQQFLHAPRFKQGSKALVITNTGAIRFDIFKGPFTRDSEFLVSPFTSDFRYLKNVPLKVAGRILELLNSKGPLIESLAVKNPGQLETAVLAAGPEQVHRLNIAQGSDTWDVEASNVIDGDLRQMPLVPHVGKDKIDLQPGYTTVDDAGTDGDDTEHSHIQFYNVPNAVQGLVGDLTLPLDPNDDQPVDVVYNSFIEPYIILALKYLGLKVTEADTDTYWEGATLTTVMTDWVKEHWKCPKDGSLEL